MADNWVVPTSHNDPSSHWTDEAKSYDDDLETYALPSGEGYLELILTSIKCDKIRFYAGADAGENILFYIDVYYSSAWHNIANGVTYSQDIWHEVSIGSTETVTKARIKYASIVGETPRLKEFNFNSLLSIVTVQDPTSVTTTTATANGNITQKGVSTITVRGFKYGLTKTDTWDAHDDGDFEVGAYTKGLTGLSDNTSYWIQAYLTDTEDTYYSEWLEFQTSASGEVPTGTKVSICSDYNGMTYKLNESYTDDGFTYESYFILSTDLADKQGLHWNKRLLDLFSYFESKDSGTCKIYIKKDNEADWQYCGEISMVGDADIIVKHLPSENQDSSGDIDFLAKHYLIKFFFENDFDFIGLITESILIGVR